MDKAALKQLKGMQEAGHEIRIVLLPHQALYLVDLIQIACANASADGQARQCGLDFVHTVVPFFGNRTALGQVIEEGWKVAR